MVRKTLPREAKNCKLYKDLLCFVFVRRFR